MSVKDGESNENGKVPWELCLKITMIDESESDDHITAVHLSATSVFPKAAQANDESYNNNDQEK